MYKLAVFDLDGTLAYSKQRITEDMARLLEKLSHTHRVAIISGGSFERFEDQILSVLKPSSRITLLPTEGAMRYEYKNAAWECTEKISFSNDLKKKVVQVLTKIIDDPSYEIPPYPEGEYIEDRETEVVFSALGQNARLEEKESWDPDKTRRLKIKSRIEREVPEVTVVVAGTTSIDILPKGFDKAKGLGIFLETSGIHPREVVFVGDAIVPGGNDYSVFQSGIQSIPVGGPIETMEVITKLIQDSTTTIETHSAPVFPREPVAYFCSEYGFEANSAMYAGGLGILAGDFVLQSADLDKPLVAFGLRYGTVIPTGFGLLENVLVEIPLGRRTLYAKVWHRAFSQNTHVVLLDTRTPENTSEDQDITARLYDSDHAVRIRQQIVLGIGGVRLLKLLNISPKIFHLNEGHTAFAGVGVLVERSHDASLLVASKHTILHDAGLFIPQAEFEELMGSYCKEYNVDSSELFNKGAYDRDTTLFSTTKFIMNVSVRNNGVSALHVVYEKKKHPQSTLIPITNGVYQKRWQARELWARSRTITDEELRKIKRKLRLDLFSYIETVDGKKFNPEVCTLVWSRRFATYKRPHLLFSDVSRLTRIITSVDVPLQVVISGKAHPADEAGQKVMREIIDFSRSQETKGRIVYLPDYSIASAEKLTRGADIWLNTPILGKEACGTSGMKAALNGALQVSVKDGWVDEVNLDGRGWSLPGDTDDSATATVLYDLLEHEILPSFYSIDEGEGSKWVSMMRSTIELVEDSYTAERMVREYDEKLYM